MPKDPVVQITRTPETENQYAEITILTASGRVFYKTLDWTKNVDVQPWNEHTLPACCTEANH